MDQKEFVETKTTSERVPVQKTDPKFAPWTMDEMKLLVDGLYDKKPMIDICKELNKTNEDVQFNLLYLAFSFMMEKKSSVEDTSKIFRIPVSVLEDRMDQFQERIDEYFKAKSSADARKKMVGDKYASSLMEIRKQLKRTGKK